MLTVHKVVQRSDQQKESAINLNCPLDLENYFIKVQKSGKEVR